ncbi:MAG: hypothetical protein SNI70_12645 [Rikenellaceae bacterium]
MGRLVLTLAVLLLFGNCAVTSRLERRQIGAEVGFVPNNDKLSMVNDKLRADTVKRTNDKEFIIHHYYWCVKPKSSS